MAHEKLLELHQMPARAFPKDARVDQAAIVENKVLSAALADVQQRQRERGAEVLAQKKLTLREEDLLRKAMGEDGLATRRPERHTIRELAAARRRRCKRRRLAEALSISSSPKP